MLLDLLLNTDSFLLGRLTFPSTPVPSLIVIGLDVEEKWNEIKNL